MKKVKKYEDGGYKTSSSRNPITGRIKVKTTQTDRYPSEIARSKDKVTFSKDGDFIKKRVKSTVTDRATGEKSTFVVKSKSQGEDKEPKRKVRRAIIPVKRTGGVTKSKKK